ELDGGGKRHISGLVTAARVVGYEGRSVTYELRMEPWVKLLTHTSDYKAFQNKTVVDILDEVLAEYPYPVEKRLVESYPVRTWQVQYGETDFDFLQRLMQEWGIYWWFEHSEDSHTLVLADAISAHKACPDSPLVEWHQEGLKLDKEFIHTITANESLRTGQWVLDDFDFTKPRSLLANTVANPRETGHATYEHYEWPGDYFDKSEGEMLTRIRMEAQRSPGSRAGGVGNIRTLMTGHTFTLMNHPTAEVNQEYLLVQTTLFLRDNAQHSGQNQHFTYVTTFELHPTREVYRPQRTVSKPHTKGPQSAIVTGPSGQEIWTDQYGRVKVQFGWDRYGKMDENSSCWIRVSY
ncbi:type VI secretion system tip protein VgrG, partial [Salmonella enterica]